jgi:hypothetical protein
MLSANSDIVDEVRAAFDAYESALLANDFDRLDQFFYNGPETTRFGTKEIERLYGHEQISTFRRSRGVIDQRRTLNNLRIVALNDTCAIANVEYYPVNQKKIGRQTQVWMKLADKWKIISAHVSFGT